MKRQNWRAIGSLAAEIVRAVELEQQRAPEGEALKLLPGPDQRQGGAPVKGLGMKKPGAAKPPASQGGTMNATGGRTSLRVGPEPQPSAARSRPILFVVATSKARRAVFTRPIEAVPASAARLTLIVDNGEHHASSRVGVVR